MRWDQHRNSWIPLTFLSKRQKYQSRPIRLFLTMEHLFVGKNGLPFGRMLEQQFKSSFSAKFLLSDSNIIRLSGSETRCKGRACPPNLGPE
ncbi:hypothetical protein MPLDJ20_260165 [Mesorhizobium plurifarium]|uniref:Uncharacterized protein n=1 Tax=Mesorhizobium plurifarium TaxID=69974 RepID=A0A090FE34_MESPL|nr:hypothetical protein MPLDJ20_260165 [Mesorhizobium plurifarium]